MYQSSKIGILFILTIVVFACVKTDPVCNDVIYNGQFTIENGGKYCFPDGNFFEVESMVNAFCPCNVDCFWEGEMLLYYYAEFDGELIETFVGSSGETTGYQFVSDLYEIHFEDILFDKECTETYPSPDIVSASVIITKVE